MIASFVFEFDTYSVNGYAAQANASVAASRGPPKRRPTSASPSEAEASKSERGGVRRRQLVPLPRPAEDAVARHVREVRDGPVRVAALVRRLAAAVRLDALADLALRVGRPAGLQVPLRRHVAVRHLAVRDPVRADHARVADVDHASRRLHVQADPEAGEEDRGGGEQPHRPERARRARRPVARARSRRSGASR